MNEGGAEGMDGTFFHPHPNPLPQGEGTIRLLGDEAAVYDYFAAGDEG